MMGFTPQEVNAMSIWQFMAALDGYEKANSSGEDKKLTEQEKDELFEWILEG
ncbi:hypothetical protein [Phyllobacterium meliloti]|uniref:hypothetical protein n=1 Tax=Phyllobacterium meliloti TaxID=555317 RepID=UPI001D151870|nr:hypothetical protein [Phyllobacterium sp. T1293]UGX87124.1 hypothetical protein LLE53_004565 [Phyllobacterium sp. T1293]